MDCPHTNKWTVIIHNYNPRNALVWEENLIYSTPTGKKTFAYVCEDSFLVPKFDAFD